MNLFEKKTKAKTKSKNPKKADWFLFFYWAIFCFLLIAIFFIEASSQLDPDLGWHLRVGQDIATERQIPHWEKYAYPVLGERWVDHEWLSNLALYLIFSSNGKYGHWFLSFVFSLLAVATFSLVLKTTRRWVLPSMPAFQFTFLASLAIFAPLHSILIFFGNRLQVLSWFFSALVFCLFAKIFVEKKYNFLPAFPAVFFLWSNMHGSFVFGLAILEIFLLFLLMQKTTSRQKIFALASGIFSLLATLLTPYGIELWKLIVIEYTANSSYLSKIAEWLPIYAKPNVLWLPSLYVAFFIFLLAISWTQKLFLRKKTLTLYLFFTLAMLALAIQSRRFLPFFSFSSIPLVVFFLKNIFQDFVAGKKHLLGLLALFSLVAFLFFFKHAPLPKNIFLVQSSFSPLGALNHIKTNPSLKDLRLLNDYNWGGYLDWMWQEKQIFIDGRMPQKPLGNKTTFFEEYQAFHQEETLGGKLDEYGIEMVLVEKKNPLAFDSAFEKFLYEKLFLFGEKDLQRTRHLQDHLEQNWKKVYEDELSVVFIRIN